MSPASIPLTIPLRTAVIGCGLIAQAIHLPRLRQMADRFALVALADRSATVREQLAARYQPARAYADWRVLLERERLDALVVCSPHATHAEIVLAALDLGINVLVEKPLCVTLDDAAAIVRRERETGLVVQVGYMKRHHPAWAALLAELPSGTDERLRLVDVVTYDPWMARAPYVRWDDLVFGSDVPEDVRERDELHRWEQLAAATSSDDREAASVFEYTYLACLVHDVNLVHGVLDRLGVTDGAEPVAASHRRDGRAADVLVTLPGGQSWRSAWMLLDQQPAFRTTATFHMTDRVAELRYDAPYLVDRPAQAERRDGDGTRTTRVAADAYVVQLERFHASVTTGAPCATPAAQARRDLALLTRLFHCSTAHTTAARAAH